MGWFDAYPKKLLTRIENGRIIEQRYWSFIKELNSFSEERLDTIALISGKRKLTYRKMFETWERFAEIFSALGITEEKNARIGLMTTLSMDCVNVIYSANMTGASVSMLHPADVISEEHFTSMVEKEGITDLILAIDVTTPEVLHRIMSSRKRLSINNVIVYSDGLYSGSRGQRLEDSKYKALKKINGVLFLDEIKKEYIGTPIQYASKGSKDGMLVFRTSGTTSGFHKPVPLSDSAFNESAARLLRDERFSSLTSVITLMAAEPVVAYSGCDMMHLPLSYGGTIILPDAGFMDPGLLKIVKDYKVSIVFAGAAMFMVLMNVPLKMDLSSVELVFMGGTYLSMDSKKRYRKFLQDCGSNAEIYVGYGLTEIGGAALLTDKDTDNDYLGKPLPGVKIKIYDEDNDVYYDPGDGARTGVLCLSSKSLSSGKLNDMTLFDLVDIDGEKYLNTCDLVDVNENGDMKIIGRMNKYFINNDGVRFDAGLVETAISGEPGIVDCGLVPEYTKTINDTIPVLYVKTLRKGPQGKAIVRKALCNVFIRDDKIVDSNLPSRVVIADDLPYTETGKVDVHRILKEKMSGDAYLIEPVRRHGRLMDIRLVAYDMAMTSLPGGIPDELTEDMKLLKEVEVLSKGRIKAPFGGGIIENRKESAGIPIGGAIPSGMLCKLLQSEDLDPEMAGRMLARFLIEKDKQERQRMKDRRRRRLEGCRGCL